MCDLGWGWDDARVACRQLGFAGGGEALAGGWFAPAPASRPIAVANVSCGGWEARLDACAASRPGPGGAPSVVGVGGCSHANDAGLACAPPRGAPVGPPPAAAATNGSGPRLGAWECATEGALRVVPAPGWQPAGVGSGAAAPPAGRLEVCAGGQWGSVCSDGWDDVDAGVACRQLGWPGGAALASPLAGGLMAAGGGGGPLAPGPADMRVALAGLGCGGGEAALLDCPAGRPLGQVSL